MGLFFLFGNQLCRDGAAGAILVNRSLGDWSIGELISQQGGREGRREGGSE